MLRVFIASLVFITLAAATPANAQLGCGDTVSVDTILTNNIGPCPGDGLVIDAPGVILDLNGFSVTGTGADSGPFGEGPAGIRISQDNSTVRNGRIKNFSDGAVIEADGVTVEDIRIRNVTNGIIAFGVNGALIRNNSIRNATNHGARVIGGGNIIDGNKFNKVGTRIAPDRIGVDCAFAAALRVFGGEFLVMNNKIRNSPGPAIDGQANDSLIIGNIISHTHSRPCRFSYAAVEFSGVNSTLASNSITHNGSDKRHSVDDGVRGNAGIYMPFQQSGRKIFNNTITDNDEGIRLGSQLTGLVEPDQFVNNCIDKNSNFGLVAGNNVDPRPPILADARHNYWGSQDGPSGAGPTGSILMGSGQLIEQELTDEVAVEPFQSKCQLTGAK